MSDQTSNPRPDGPTARATTLAVPYIPLFTDASFGLLHAGVVVLAVFVVAVLALTYASIHDSPTATWRSQRQFPNKSGDEKIKENQENILNHTGICKHVQYLGEIAPGSENPSYVEQIYYL